MRDYKIVCVDDEELILEIYKSSLEEIGHEIVTFSNPEKALKYIIENKTSIITIISDYKMPEMNGLELREGIIQNNIFIPFFMVTGYYNKEMAVKGMELKISKFIQKPFAQETLIEQIQVDFERYMGQLEEEYEMISSFVDESSPMLDEIEELILQLEDSPNDVECLNTYFRLLHTIKGTASCVGLVTLPEFAHKYEDLVGNLKHGGIQVNNEIIDILLKGLDVLRTMYSDISKGVRYEFEIAEDIKIFNLDNINKQDVEEDHQEKSEKLAKEKKVEDEKLGIQVSLLDEFMELSGEITVLRNMVLKSVSKIEGKYEGDKDIDVLTDSLDEMHKVSSQLQNQISEMRKVTISGIYRPLKRVVRDASKKLSKDVDLILEGEELRVDTSVGKVLSNALVHLVRNGIDHGIETVTKREEIGKDKTGTLKISTYLEGENIIVRVKDDGNGIDKNRLIEKAIEKELYTKEDLDKMSSQRILGLIFDSGFSTASAVTDISGRGVGMDMVKSSVESINGKINIDSRLGEGTTFNISIPIPRSVLIIKSLMISLGQEQFAIPLDDISEVVDVEKSKDLIEELGDGYVIRLHDELIPIVDLRKDFYGQEECHEGCSVIVLKNEQFHYGIVVDDVHDIEEIVVKKLVKKLQSDDVLFLGATLIGDGEMALIFDLEKIASYVGISIHDVESDFVENLDSTDMSITGEYVQVHMQGIPNACIPLDSIDRLEEFHSSKVTYSGNIPIYRYRDNFLPLVELDQKTHGSLIRKKDILKVVVLNNDDKKIGLIVSEINDILNSYENVDELFSNNKEIQGTVYINENTLNVLDTDYIFKNYKEMYTDEPIIDNDDIFDEAA